MINLIHLLNWMTEIEYQLTGINKEISKDKLKHINGINIDVGVLPKREEVFVSFEYLREKSDTITGILKCIEDDIKND